MYRFREYPRLKNCGPQIFLCLDTYFYANTFFLKKIYKNFKNL